MGTQTGSIKPTPFVFRVILFCLAMFYLVAFEFLLAPSVNVILPCRWKATLCVPQCTQAMSSTRDVVAHEKCYFKQ